MIRVVLIDLAKIHDHVDDVQKDLYELQSLVKTYGGIDIVHIIQHRNRPDKNTFIGSGKADELAHLISQKRIDKVIINALVNPVQLFNLTRKLWEVNPKIEVWDRIDLILNIFDKHARTAEARLQIEIARMRHMGPRIYGLGGTYFSRQAGGIGTRGIGETNIELMKRHWRSQIKKKKDELEKLSVNRMRQLARRRELNLKTVSLIGYTNAGKTSLFNFLTGKDHPVQNALFVTLDSAVGNVDLGTGRGFILSDTIGFIRNLPTSLIESFKSTLMESVNADLLLHVIDISDNKMAINIDTVNEVLKSIGIEDKKQLMVFNKTDMVLPARQKLIRHLLSEYLDRNPQFISVATGSGMEELKTAIAASLGNI